MPPPGNGWFEVYVTYEDASPVENAAVSILTPTMYAMTDVTGYCLLPSPIAPAAAGGAWGFAGLAPGAYKIYCYKAGVKDPPPQLKYITADRGTPVEFTLKKEEAKKPRRTGGGHIYGQVWIKDAQGRDQPFTSDIAGPEQIRARNIVIAIRSVHRVLPNLGIGGPAPGGGGPNIGFHDFAEYTGRIDENGRYVIENLPPDHYDVVCYVADPREGEWHVADSRKESQKEEPPHQLPHHAQPASRYPLRERRAVKVREGQSTKCDFHFYPSGGARWARVVNTGRNWIEHRWGMGVMANFPAIALTMIGFIISNNYQNTNFLLGFLSLAMYFLLPEPIAGRLAQEMAGGHIQLQVKWKDFVRRGENREQFNNAWRWLIGNNNSAWSLLRAGAKTSAIWFFAQGLIQSTFPFASLLLFVLAFVGYFSLPIEYDARGNSGQFLESVIRFGILGAYIIPWVIFAQIFDSLVLGLVAFAFFAVPPVPKQEQQSNVAVFSSLALMEKFFFLGVMFLALMWSGALLSVFPALSNAPFFQVPAGWNLKGALADTFFFFWVIYTIAGFFAPPQERPAAGFIMLGASTIIYAIGPGTQEVGQGLLGPYFPAFYKGMIGFAKPFSSAMSGIGTAFSPALMLLFNPVVYAQNITQGIYANPDPQSGVTGAFGVEVDLFKSEDTISIGQSYSLHLRLKNMGASKARNITVSLRAGEKAPEIEKEQRMGVMPFKGLFAFNTSRETMNLAELGFSDRAGNNETSALDCDEVSGIPIRCTLPPIKSMDKLYIEDIFIESDDDGIQCKASNKYGLYGERQGKFLPFAATVSYDYGISSSLDIEFMSQDEFNRKSRNEEHTFLERKPATLSNSPVMLNIDTSQQPIRENVQYYLRFNLHAAASGVIENVYDVRAEVPTEMMKYVRKCNPRPSNTQGIAGKNVTLLIWEKDRIPYSKTILCHFNRYLFSEDSDKGKQPTKSFLIKANANYRFAKIDEATESIGPGTVPCCSRKDPITNKKGNDLCRERGYNSCDFNRYQCSEATSDKPVQCYWCGVNDAKIEDIQYPIAGEDEAEVISICKEEVEKRKKGSGKDAIVKDCSEEKAGVVGEPDYCEKKIKGKEASKCNVGEGGCLESGECCSYGECLGEEIDVNGDLAIDNNDNLQCNINVKAGVCCPGSFTDAECEKTHDLRLQGRGSTEIVKIILGERNQKTP